MNIKLIPAHPDYADLFLAWRKESLTRRHNPLLSMTIDECRKRLQAECGELVDLWLQPSFRWFINLEGNIVGHVGLTNINKMMLTAEIGYGLGEKYQGRGLASAGVRLLIQNVFEQTPLRKLVALVHEQNLPSRRLLLRIGFQEEGFLREHYIINGKAENEVIFGLLKREWST
jgi:ribosomal-protein-alanine N-acetyltransferase